MVATDDEIQVLCFSFFFCFNHIFCSAFEKSLRARLVKVIIPTVKIHFWTQQYCSINNFFFFPNQTNPDTDYHCLKTFGSYFKQDIQIPAVISYWSLYLFGNWYDGVNLKSTGTFQGTTIDFRQTADGQLITESE